MPERVAILSLVGLWGLCIGMIAWCIVLMRRYEESPNLQTALIFIAINAFGILLAALHLAVCVFLCGEHISAALRWLVFLGGLTAGVGVISLPDQAIRALVRQLRSKDREIE